MLLAEVLSLHIFWSVPLAERSGRPWGDHSEIQSPDPFLQAAGGLGPFQALGGEKGLCPRPEGASAGLATAPASLRLPGKVLPHPGLLATG